MTKKQIKDLLKITVTKKSVCKVMGWSYPYFNNVINGSSPCGRRNAGRYSKVIGGTEADWMCGDAAVKEKLWTDFVARLTG